MASSVLTMVPDVVGQLGSIWPLVCNERGSVHYFAKGSQGVTGGEAKDPNHLAYILGNLGTRNFNAYINFNPSRHTSLKGGSADVYEWRHVLIDVDPVDSDANPQAVVETVGRYVDLSACTVINSGRGMQLWLALEPTRMEDGKTRRAVERGMAGYLTWLGSECDGHGCRIDTGMSNLDRVVRPPGSINQKSGRTARLISVASRRAKPEDVMARALPEAAEPKRLENVKSWNLLAVLPHLTERAADFLTEGLKEPGRHAGCYAAAACLRELGVPQDAAMPLVINGGNKCRPRLRVVDMERVLRNAYSKGEG